MNIVCPACSTSYSVLDSAVGRDGRVVRCAKCRHSWFQDGYDTADADAEVAASTAATAERPAAMVDGAPDAPDDAPGPIAEVPSASAAPPQTPDFAETPSSFAHEPPFRPRRNPAFFWIVAIILFLLVAAGAVAAMASFGVPDWLPLPHDSFAQAQPDLELKFPPNQQQWRPLPNGNSFFNVSGTIVNAGQERRPVPTLEIVLRDAHAVAVYSLEAASPKPVLAPGESETIDQAIIDAPKSARTAAIGWKAP